jgi:hypothetical protein
MLSGCLTLGLQASIRYSVRAGDRDHLGVRQKLQCQPCPAVAVFASAPGEPHVAPRFPTMLTSSSLGTALAIPSRHERTID